MNKIISKLYFNQILNNPKKVIVSLMIVLAVMSLFITNFKLDASADSLILENDKDLMLYRDTVERYETKEFIVLTYTPKTGSVFDDKNLSLIKKLKSKLLKINGVNSIISLVDVPLVESSDIPIVELVNNVPNILSKEVDVEKAEEEILSSPIYKNLIISEDGETTALQVTFKNNKELTELSKIKTSLITKELQDEMSEEESMYLEKVKKEYEQLKYMHDENMHNMLINIRLIKTNFENDHDVEIRMGGIPMIADDMIGYVKSDLINFGVGVFIFIVTTLIIIFRNLKWVILPLLSCAYAVIIMIGLLGLMNWQVTVISSNFISLMLILTLSMNIHLIVRYKQLCQLSSVTQYKLVCLTTEKMVWPCLYTALTTIVAFASLVFSDIKPVIDFGYMMILGLSVTFLTSFLLLPCILCLLKKEVTQNNNENKEFKFTKSLANFTINNGRYVIGLSLSLLLITLFGVSQLRVENSFINYFKSNTEIYKGMKQIDDKLGGTTPLDIIIKFEEKSKYLIEEDDFGNDLLDDEEPSDSEWFKVRKVDKIKLIHDYLAGVEFSKCYRIGKDSQVGARKR